MPKIRKIITSNSYEKFDNEIVKLIEKNKIHEIQCKKNIYNFLNLVLVLGESGVGKTCLIEK